MKHNYFLAPCLSLAFLLTGCTQTRTDGWYLVENHSADSLLKNPILTIADFQGLKMDSVSVQGKTTYFINGGTKPEKMKAFADATEKQIGKRIAFVYQGRVISDPMVNARIDTGNWEISFSNSKEAHEVFGDLRQRMGRQADMPVKNGQEVADQKLIYILPNAEPISYKQHFQYNDRLIKLHRKWEANGEADKKMALKDYPEYGELVAMGRCITAPLIIQLMLKEYRYLLPLYEAVQDSSLCASAEIEDAEQRLDETITLFVTKVMKQPRTRFKNDAEKLKAMKELVKEEYRPQSLSDAQLDAILLQYDYDLWKGVLQMNKSR